MDESREVERNLADDLLREIFRWLLRKPVGRAISRFIIWAATEPFSTAVGKLLTFGLPPVLGFILVFVRIPPLISIIIVFTGFFILIACREFYWTMHRRALSKTQRKVQQLVLTEKLLAKSFLHFAKRVKCDWHYKSLHAKYWIDEDPKKGRFRRDMRITLAKRDGPLIACIGRVRIGAQGEGTELQPVSALDLAVTCHEPDVYALLLPIELDHDNPIVPERWHIFTILVYATPSCGPELHIALSGNWLWRAP